VFVDETWAKTNMAPLRGWAPKGQRLHAKVPYGHWKTMTFIAALRCDRIDAPFVFDQPINGTSFTQWVEEQLCPTLGPGDIVILDNLSSHKKPAVRTAIRARGARLLFLPPDSPDLNPIEQVSPSSNTCCAKPPNERKRPPGSVSARYSMHSHPKNAPTTSKTQGTVQRNVIRL
jgi:DDE superfamily endonuclease